MKKALFIAIVPLIGTESAMLNALNIGADDGRKSANGTEKGKTMLKFVLFAMIGYKLNMGKWYWWTLNVYVALWTICKIMGWL